MSQPFKAALAYFAMVFALGFVLGVPRVLLVAPHLGEMAATALELPVMLGASWLISRRLTRRLSVARSIDRLIMGAMAFALLMLAEMSLSVLVFGWSLQEHLATYRTGPTALGLLGQIAFGLIPWCQGRITAMNKEGA